MKQNALSNILIVTEVISKDGLKYLLNEINKSKKEDLSVFDPDKSNETGKTEWVVDKKIRDTQIVNTSKDCFHTIIDLYKDTVKNIINPFYEFEIKDSEIPQILSYNVGGHYEPHVDAESIWVSPKNEKIWRRNTERDLSTVLFLNDDFEGGDLIFPDLKIRVRPEPGMLICFPSTHEYIHGVEPVTKGTRYSIVNWMTIKGFPTMEEESKLIYDKYGVK
jgi:predicted 2-oxoglutarate/Fe(II)-dependent dioxygenase YbiX